MNWDAWVKRSGSVRDPRFDVLFEPVKIGPISAKNRFFQVPHCNGMGYRDISAHAMMRRVKAEGGWAVVCTEEVEIHPTSDVTPYIEGRLWDDRDIPAHARVAEAIHDGGALAGFVPRIKHEVMETSTLVTLVAAGLGVAIVPEPTAALDVAGIRYLHLTPASAGVDLVAARMAGEPSALLDNVIGVLRQIIRTEPGADFTDGSGSRPITP